MMLKNRIDIKGLSDEEVILSREKFGLNKLSYKKGNEWFDTIKRIAKDPMLLLLITAASIYFISGKIGDGIFLSVAIVFQTSISLYQYKRSKNALEKLKEYSQPNCKVIRNGGSIVEIKSEYVVIGDSLIVEEGSLISADGPIVHSNDFSVDESILTGESLAVIKDAASEDNHVYSGTNVLGGMAIAEVTQIGNETKLGKIGTSLEKIKEELSPLEIQVANFVKKMATFGIIVFLIVWAINFMHSKSFIESLLQSLTLAMSILPEEIPVAFTTFMALGAWRLMKMGIIVKQMKTVETLGSATVICTDKTGTITENKMSIAKLYLYSSNKINNIDGALTSEDVDLIQLSMWASEPLPFDPMEVAIHKAYGDVIQSDERPNFALVHEYPLSGKPPMMTHVFSNKAGQRIIAAKGAPEAIIQVSKISKSDILKINAAIELLAKDGYRVLAVAESTFKGQDYPDTQHELPFQFKGIFAFYDPPKQNIQIVLQKFYAAGIDVKIITGDKPTTTMSIAKQVGFRGFENSITGDELMKIQDSDLPEVVSKTAIFTRMFPEAKLKIINALKANGEIVAMTGDGVNDGPALKAAHIGIAMGKKGSEIAKQAASLILIEDDLSKMVDAIAMGRKIYANLKKAIQYIISIHIPIILTVFVPLALGWIYPNIFSPIHIIFLEIIMGPTCSIIYENEPMEKNTMLQKPKALSSTFFSWKELSTSIIQGLVITLATLSIYQYNIYLGNNEITTRTMIFTVLITANIFLTLINRSFYYSIITTLQYKNNMVIYVVMITISLVGIILFIKPMTNFFDFETLNLRQLLICISVGFISVVWFEILKMLNRIKKEKNP